MRFASRAVDGIRVYAVTGTNTISFGIHATDKARRKLLGFAVERYDPVEAERYIMPGFKVFASVVPVPTPDAPVSTWEHPVQSFVWDDFTAKDGREYVYYFHPLRGAPKNLDRTGKVIAIRVRTEPVFSSLAHDIFFNRGVASSQAYQRRFGNVPPDQLPNDKRQQALDWLQRDLDNGILKFIAQATSADTLRCAFYEFHYPLVLDALKAAIDAGVTVEIIIDAKQNRKVESDGTVDAPFPRDANLAAIAAAGIPDANVIRREARPNDIQHNKFIVLSRAGLPAEVWTGSTNISLGGFTGQTNVGHWVRDAATAQAFSDYWQLLSSDPGAAAGATPSAARGANAAMRAAVAAIRPVPTQVENIANGVTPVFSPRSGSEVLELYATLLDSASDCACITFAFGIGKRFKQRLVDNTAASPILFLLLEQRDKATASTRDSFVSLNAKHNVYEAWGSYIKDPVYQWARETNAQFLKLNQHVVYVHSKFLIRDPLGADPIVVTGSANFSDASTNDNDENMLIIRGSQRVADIYFTEFNRLFNHYYFRSVVESLKEKGIDPSTDDNLFLAEDDSWLAKYAPGTLRTKRLALFTGMVGKKTLAVP